MKQKKVLLLFKKLILEGGKKIYSGSLLTILLSITAFVAPNPSFIFVHLGVLSNFLTWWVIIKDLIRGVRLFSKP